MDAQTQEKIQQLQLIEQNLNNFLQQRQHFQAQLVETESALKEIETSTETFKIIGNIMVKADNSKIKIELTEKKEKVELRIKSIENQENKMREKADILQKEVMNVMQSE